MFACLFVCYLFVAFFLYCDCFLLLFFSVFLLFVLLSVWLLIGMLFSLFVYQLRSHASFFVCLHTSFNASSFLCLFCFMYLLTPPPPPPPAHRRKNVPVNSLPFVNAYTSARLIFYME